jgi:hypothetical protein
MHTHHAAECGDPGSRQRRKPRDERRCLVRTLLATPPFPEYTSGHSTFSAVAATVLAYVLASDRTRFAVGSDNLPGVRRSYSSFKRRRNPDFRLKRHSTTVGSDSSFIECRGAFLLRLFSPIEHTLRFVPPATLGRAFSEVGCSAPAEPCLPRSRHIRECASMIGTC